LTASTDKRRWFRLALGIALSGLMLWLALRQASLSEIGDAFAKVDARWIPAMLALKALTLVIKDIRWRVELKAMAPGAYRHTFRAIGLGYFGNIVLPFKLGEVLRVGLLKRHNPDVGLGDALATIAAERALDGAILAVMVGAVLHTANVPPWVLSGTILLLAVMLGVIAVSMLTPVHRFFLDRLPKFGPLGLARKVIAALTKGTAVLRQPKPFAMAAALTALAWVAESGVFYCGVLALDVPIGYTSTLVVTLLLSVGLLIPSAPGQIGTHQALCVLFLEPFGVAAASAVSLSFLLQGVALSTLGTIGGYVLVREAGARQLIAEGAPAPGSDPPAAGDPPQP
jgi:uncharacterized protein (TIRG00374 family)